MHLWTSKNYHKNDKIYRGAFHYFRNENQYAEENFDVYRDKKEQSYHYISEIVARVSTGEILNMHVEYCLNKEFVPTYLFIEKIMGKDFAIEKYEFNPKKNQIHFEFKSNKTEDTTTDIATAPKFFITSPSAAASMLFLRSKKLDSSGKSSFNILSSQNQWEFQDFPQFKNILIERANLTAEKINIEGQNVQAVQYKMYEDIPANKSAKDPAHVKVYLSQHGGIPYMIKSEDGTKIQIKFLNDLSDKE